MLNDLVILLFVELSPSPVGPHTSHHTPPSSPLLEEIKPEISKSSPASHQHEEAGLQQEGAGFQQHDTPTSTPKKERPSQADSSQRPSHLHVGGTKKVDIYRFNVFFPMRELGKDVLCIKPASCIPYGIILSVMYSGAFQICFEI